jgi:hypothetical protein
MIQISRVLHAGYVFESAGTQIAFDPIFENPFSRNCFAYPSVEFDGSQIRSLEFAAVFISHFHDDHCSFDSLDLLDRRTPIYMYCLFEEMFSMLRELGFLNVHSLDIDQPVVVGPMTIIPRRALDADVDSMFQVKEGDLNILNVVDSWIDSDTLDLLAGLAPWDLILWPFQTLRELEVLAPTHAVPAPNFLPPEWVQQLQRLNPKYVVPSSCQFHQEDWSWYNRALFPISYRQFQAEIGIALPHSKVVRLNPGESFNLDRHGLQKTAPLSWVLPVGNQDIDYEYDPDLIPPPMSEVAMNFASLSEDQTERVLKYCRLGLPQKFKTLEPPLDPYFQQPRKWRLSVFDHTGSATCFYYILNGREIEETGHDDENLAWSTEIPLAKLFAALDSGESLTSMYVRINSAKFDQETYAIVSSVDLVEDPLVRCVFNGEFGAYQLNQLKKLKEREKPRKMPLLRNF